MNRAELKVLDWGYQSIIRVNDWMNDNPSLGAIDAWYHDRDFILGCLTFVATIAAVSFGVVSLKETKRSTEIGIRKNKEVILRDRMIGVMNNIIGYVHDGGSYKGAGMHKWHPINDHVGGNTGIIAKWYQISPEQGSTNGNRIFVFVYRIFSGTKWDLEAIMNESDWVNSKESVSIYLTRTKDGHYTLTDINRLNNADDFNSESITACLEDKHYDYIMMILNLLAVSSKSELEDFQKELDERDEANSDNVSSSQSRNL